MELEKAQTRLSRKIFDVKAKIKYIEEQWVKSAYEIKENILAQVEVTRADFSELRLHRMSWMGALKMSLLMRTMRLTWGSTRLAQQLILELFI